jgi:hypothetical protein
MGRMLATTASHGLHNDAIIVSNAYGTDIFMQPALIAATIRATQSRRTPAR